MLSEMFIMLVTALNYKTGSMQLYSVSESSFFLNSSRALLYYEEAYIMICFVYSALR